MAEQSTSYTLSETARTEIDHWLAKFPAEQKRSAVIAALTVVQSEEGGSLTTPAMDAVAAYLDMPPIAVYEVGTFYSMFDLHPVGRHKISVCKNISCMLMGADDIVAHLQNKLAIKLGETSSDGRITLIWSRTLWSESRTKSA